MGVTPVTGTFKVGLGVYHVRSLLDHKENSVIHHFFSVGEGVDPVIFNRGTLDLPLVLSTKVEIGPLNSLHRILSLCCIRN